MLIFGIDTCCMAATAALMEENKLVAQTVISHDRTHSQKMMPQIESMLQLAETELSQVDCFAAAVGPGSFTGVRIGVATVKALAQAMDKPCCAVSTLKGLAFNNMHFSGIICPILDARRNQVYHALFQGGRELKRLCEDRALGIEELLEELSTKEQDVLFCGDGTLVFRKVIEERLGGRAVFANRMQNLNLAGAVAEIALMEQETWIPCGELVPQYVRLSQAERERLEKEQAKEETR